MTTLLEDLQKFQAKRKFPNWEPKANAGVKQLRFTPDEEVVLRCLQFVELEVQVGDWITEASKGFEGQEVLDILMRNVADEIKHEQSIRDLQAYYGAAKEKSLRAAVICDRWKRLADNPVVAAYALEMGIFFTILPILMKCGDLYAATVASWINDDERVHVETNLRLMKHYGYKLSAEVVALVYNTVEFIYQPLDKYRAAEEASRAVKRLVTTKDPRMLTESLPLVISYFEQDTNDSVVYS